MTYALGIDLGTTFTAAATWRDGHAEIASLGSRAAVIPSVVLLREDETVLTGETAHRRGLSEPHRVSREFKRRLGDTTPILLGGVPYSAEALMAKLLRAVVDDVAQREGGPSTAVCISHPANWGPYKKDLLSQGVRMSGMEQPVTLTTEPEAAAVFYARQQRVEPGAVVAVYDLGGGTFDAAVLRKTATGFEILGQPEGIERLGGIDFDAAVFNHVRQALGGKLDELDEDDPTAIAAVGRLREECVAAKEALSSDTDASIPVLLPNTSTEIRLTRGELEAMVRPTLHSTIEALGRALRSAQVAPEQLHSVLLIGGSSRMPLVAQMVGAELGRPVAVDAHPKHAVALGAAWIASGESSAPPPGSGTAGAAAAGPARGGPGAAGTEAAGPTAPGRSPGAVAGAGAVGAAAGMAAGAAAMGAAGSPAAPGSPAPGSPAAGSPAAPGSPVGPAAGGAGAGDPRPTFAGSAAVPPAPPVRPVRPVPPPRIQRPPSQPHPSQPHPGRPPTASTRVFAGAAAPVPRAAASEGYAGSEYAGAAASRPGGSPGGPSGSRRRLAVIGAAALVFVLAATGVAWAVANREDPGTGGLPSGQGATEAPSEEPTTGPAEQGQQNPPPPPPPDTENTEPHVPPDEQCTPEIMSNPRWVCLTSAAHTSDQLILEYDAEWGGDIPSTEDGYHLHIYGGDGTNPSDYVMGTQAGDQRGVWKIRDENPAVLSADEIAEVIGDYPKVCARIADAHHALVQDNDGGYTTGNCMTIQW